MSDRILDRYTGRRSTTESDLEPASSDPDGTEDLVAFGWLRGPRERATMIELRKRTGQILAVSYGFIDRIQFDPSTGITLRCGRESIVIKGRNLNAEARPQVRLFQGLTRHRVPWVAEIEPASRLRAEKDAIFVEAIEWSG